MKAGIKLWFAKEDGLTYNLGAARFENFENLGMNIPRPWPATYIGDTFIVNCNDCKLVAGYACR